MKIFSLLCIVMGAVFIFIFDDNSEYDKYLKVLGFVIFMFGLYNATKLWVKDNPREDKKENDPKSLDNQLKE